jgi:glucosamine--fructose-6-phosphate aminotransferase (isomerizing)
MCGIIGIIGKPDVETLLVESLKRLEYRGYDSAGIAVLNNKKIVCIKSEGKIQNLETKVSQKKTSSEIGIGHTRWATHGAPNEKNAHPHCTENVAVVHNGIIENYENLRRKLEKQGHKFSSDTDTEVITQFLDSFLRKGTSPKEAMQKTLKEIEGAFAIAALFKNHDDLIICARYGSPLAIGIGKNAMFLGSDAMALSPFTQKICYLEEGDWAILHKNDYEIYDANNKKVNRSLQKSGISNAMIGKDGHRHFMMKEIHEQPNIIAEIFHYSLDVKNTDFEKNKEILKLKNVETINIIACGTSFYAGLVAKHWIEEKANIPVNVDIASEFRYRKPPITKNSLSIFISQSGETADTLAALKYVKSKKGVCIALVNVEESSIAREADATLKINAGPEIGVASTKAFTAQLSIMACLTLLLGKEKGTINQQEFDLINTSLKSVPSALLKIFKHEDQIIQAANYLMKARSVLYLGRGLSFPIAMEGALKLKELSYIHAEGYAAGEMKHGPIALIDENVPIVVLAPSDELYGKTISNVEEVIARDGQVIFISDAAGIEKFNGKVKYTIEIPKLHTFCTPLLYSLPVQLLAYHTANLKGTDVDQPRNLAKSVTVE